MFSFQKLNHPWVTIKRQRKLVNLHHTETYLKQQHELLTKLVVYTELFQQRYSVSMERLPLTSEDFGSRPSKISKKTKCLSFADSIKWSSVHTPNPTCHMTTNSLFTWFKTNVMSQGSVGEVCPEVAAVDTGPSTPTY